MTDQDAMEDWLSDHQPHEPARSAQQIEGVRRLLEPAPKRVLDLGCGCGRVALPLVHAGHDMVCIDHSAASLRIIRERSVEREADIELIEADFTQPWPVQASSFDAVLVLGNTIMTLHDVDRAVELFRQAREALRPDGMLLIDDCPQDFWPQLTEGNWLSGLSEDGQSQLVWDEGDAVFTLRRGELVDEAEWRIRPEDRRFRLWSMGLLQLACALAGLSAPAHQAEAAVLIMQPKQG